MELFSKRYPNPSLRSRYFLRPEAKESADNLIGLPARNKLFHDLKYIIKSNDFLEPFLVTNDTANNSYYLNDDTLRDLSTAELGYDLTKVVEPISLSLLPQSKDAYFFDLLELLVIFAKDNKRDELISRLDKIFQDETRDFSMNSFMIISKTETGLRSIIPLLKDRLLKEKLAEYFNPGSSEFKAQISADIIQFLFSSEESKGKTKEYAETLVDKVATKWTDEEHKERLKCLINSAVKNARDFNNEVSNIRHTDKHAIPIEKPDFYRLIARNNLSLIELVILTLPADYIFSKDPEKMKEDYLKRFNISNRMQVLEPQVEEINIDDIPF